jgi:ATP:cob(I)alamin adenosyltransferase
MRRIYTKTGDKGTTAIAGGSRVEKDDIRIETNGTIDELNSIIGIVRSMLPTGHEWQPLLYDIQFELMNMMANIVTPAESRKRTIHTEWSELTLRCEQTMDEIMPTLQDNNYFILPGGSPVSSYLQWARTIARRAERRLWTLHKSDSIPEEILTFFNRLSDLFFILAKQELQTSNLPEERWKTFTYRKEKKE